MKKLKPLLALFVLMFLISCGHVYKEYEKESFSALTWKPGQDITFYPEIKDTAKTYDLTLAIRYLYGSTIPKINLSLKIISPSKKVSEREFDFNLTDASGKSMGSCAGNICDFEKIIGEIKFPESGKYQITIAPADSQERVLGIMEFGLIIDEK